MPQAEDTTITEANIGPNAGASHILAPPSPYSPATIIPRSVPNHASQGGSGFVDSSGPIFSMYMKMAEEEDKKMAESWQADAQGILFFVRLYLLILCLTPAHQL